MRRAQINDGAIGQIEAVYAAWGAARLKPLQDLLLRLGLPVSTRGETEAAAADTTNRAAAAGKPNQAPRSRQEASSSSSGGSGSG